MGGKLEQIMDDLPPDRRAKVERRAANLILKAVDETARDLHKAGLIDKHQMRESDALYPVLKSDCGSTPGKRPKRPENPKR